MVLAAWLLLALAACGRAFLVPFSDRHAGIFPVYARAGVAWFHGQPVYAEQDGFDVFRYSPLVAALLVPFGLLPDPWGNLLWRALNLGVFLFGVRAWVRCVLPADLPASRRGVVYLLAGFLAATGLIDAQVNALVIGCLLLASADLARNRFGWAAVWSASACLLKLFPVAFALLLVLLRPRSFAPRWVLAVLAGLFVPFLLQDPDLVWQHYRSWIHLLGQDFGRQDWPLDLSYRDLRFLFRVYLLPLPPQVWPVLQLLGGLLIAGLIVALRWRKEAENRILVRVLGLSCCWMLVLGPATEGCTYILLAPSLAWAVVESFRTSRRPDETSGSLRGRWLRRGALLVAVGLLVTASAAPWFPGGKQIHLLGPHPLAGTLVLGCFLIDAARSWARRRPLAPEVRPPLARVA
jgi:hypothetical protein